MAVDVNQIKRNNRGFGFVEALGSFINNIKFKRGFDESQLGKDTKDSYIWKALSCMGEEYGEVVYENVLNYLDNVANVDLCKIKALQSMMKVVGIEYDVLKSFSAIPVEIANLMDVLSINRKYLLDSKTFKEDFILLLKENGVIKQAQLDPNLSAELMPDMLSSISADLSYLDENKYKNFLYSVYNTVLTSYVYMKYADAEAGVDSRSDKTYIYEYIKDEILANQAGSDTIDSSSYYQKMAQLKIKYNLAKSFNQEAIIDAVENGYDQISNYNAFEQEVLYSEVARRQATYSYNKDYLDNDVAKGFSLTRYSYYREKKVKEYFKFIEDTYNNLIIEQGIKNAVEGNQDITIQPYKHDRDYFDINQPVQKSLLAFDDQINNIVIHDSYIKSITQLLVEQTLAIADIRDQVKLQVRKSYMRGTFLLISYVINEFLKYNVADKYGKAFSTEDGVDLSTMITKSIIDGDNVELIEYYDQTEYFNIKRDVDSKAKNGEQVNEKFWDNVYDTIGKTTKDIPLAEIDEFYKKQLKLESKQVTDLVNFLSIIYEYGANDSYISKRTGEFTTRIAGKEYGDSSFYIGAPSSEISVQQEKILSVQAIHDGVDKYIENGYIQSVDVFDAQLTGLCSWISSDYFWNEISTANEDLKSEVVDQLCADYDEAKQAADSLAEISSAYENLKADSKLSYYLGSYIELSRSYFIEKLHNFKQSVTNSINWENTELSRELTAMRNAYNELSTQLFDKLFKLSVWQDSPTMYWPYYSPDFEAELTSVTSELKNFLTAQAQEQNEGALQHLQDHYEKLLGYKGDLNNVIQKCNNAIGKYEAMKAGVEAVSLMSMEESYQRSYDIIIGPVVKVVPEWVDKDDKSLGVEYKDDGYVEWGVLDRINVESPAIFDSDSIQEKLDKLGTRAKVVKYSKICTGKVLAVSNEAPDENCEYFSKREAHNYSYTIKYDEDESEKYYEYYFTYTYTSTNATWYDPDVFSQPWAGAFSQSTASEIIADLGKAIEDLNATIKLINSEIDCLGSAFSRISEFYGDENDVLEGSESAYQELIDLLTELDDYIKAGSGPDGWHALNSDGNLNTYRDRFNRILDINLSSSKEYNIRYIETRFSAIQLSIQNVLANDSEYFEDFVNNESDRLDKQISAIEAYRKTHDSQMSALALSQATQISSDYVNALNDFMTYFMTVSRKIVDSINDDYSYNLSTSAWAQELYGKLSSCGYYNDNSSWPQRYKDCLDFMLSGDYVVNGWSEKLSGVLFWLPKALEDFETSIIQQINQKIPVLPAYIEITTLLDLAKNQFAKSVKDEEMLLTEKLDIIEQDLSAQILHISSQIPFYDKSHEIYLKYNGTDVGYDPFYNYKNTAYSSYQIHPYLYNFVEKLNLVYPLANNFFISFGEDYEQKLYDKGIDNLLGQFGNIKNLWKSGMFDWTGYQSKYERQADIQNFTTGSTNPNIGFTGLFYPPAINAFLKDRDNFLQNVQDNVVNSFYYHLDLTNNDVQRIYEQLLAYEPMIRYVATAQTTGELSGEFDIYKYAEDCMGNSIFLLKSYKHLYEKHRGENGYTPSYHEKRNTPGELWMRIKNHPLAFPAIDLRKGYEDMSQYSVKKSYNSKAEDINSYISVLNDYFKSHEVGSLSAIAETAKLTRDTIGMYQIGGENGIEGLDSVDFTQPEKAQHLRCFFDFELDPLNQAILLVVPYRTGMNNFSIYHDENLGVKPSMKLDFRNLRYADSSIVIAYLGDKTLFNDMTDQTHVYVFKADVYTQNNANIDNIANKQMLVNGSIAYQTSNYFSEFIGFAKNRTYIYALFAQKYLKTNADGAFTFVYKDQRSKYRPQLKLEYVRYKCHMNPVSQVVTTDDLLYDIYDWHGDSDRAKGQDGMPLDYTNASNIAVAYSEDRITVGFATARRQTVRDDYSNNSHIVNFTEYTAQIESYNAISTAGQNTEYPKSTALIQTNDSQHINIYNSFDSFTQSLVNAEFKIVGTKLKYSGVKYFNLNSDIGFLPQYVAAAGTTHYNQNTALCNATQLNIELLGPEKSDIAFTPVIKMTEDEKYGRVTEDYKDISKLSVFNNKPLTIMKNSRVTTYTIVLSDAYIADLENNQGMPHGRALQEWNDFAETPDLMRYKYIVYNAGYLAQPILKGSLSTQLPDGYYYQGSEMYDLLSGEEIIGPNQTTYQNICMTNHIDNISVITAYVDFDEKDTGLPSALTLCCITRMVDDQDDMIIPENTFYVLIYVKNNIKLYEYHHLFENANSNVTPKIQADQTWSMDMSHISSELSDVEIDGLKPFMSVNKGKYQELSACLEFKYSEEEQINSEFPNIDPVDVEDEITIVQNDDQSIYYFTLDSYKSISVDVFYMDTFEPNWLSQNTKGRYRKKINPLLPKYREFYDRALVIEAAYNMEKRGDSDTEYEIVQYFNYKNFTNPQYVKLNWPEDKTKPPEATVVDSTDKSLEGTYLVLRPGESGQLKIRIDFVDYQRLSKNFISQSIVGAYSQELKTYYIMNVSDEKPKFIISKKPFATDEGVKETDNYELEDTYYAGMAFRYVMMIIRQTRSSEDATSNLYNYVAMSQLEFKKPNGEKFAFPANAKADMNDGAGASIVYPNVPDNLLNDNENQEFFASNLSLAAGNYLSVTIDIKDQLLDVTEYTKWSWYNSHCSNSHVGYMPKSFILAFSNDKVSWYKGDSFDDHKNSLPTTNYAEAYTGEIRIEE